ncbi:kinesin heavy chain [Spatholobus suberectus]|nr:kinesin heavy chain [Spatholobus suberectus]
MIAGCFNFNQPNTPSSSGSYCSQSQLPQNVITCVYQTQLCDNSPTYLTLSWSKTLFSHSLTISAADVFSITIPLKSSTFSFFRTRHGSKSIRHRNIKLHWNFTRAEFVQNSAEPDSRFYFAVSHNGKLRFFLGDLLRVLSPRRQQNPPEAVLLSRREHVFGSRCYVSRAVFMGSKHEIEIECGGGVLGVKVDGETRLVVKRLAWKFRGYEKIFIGGVEVEFYWDVLSWVVNSDGNGSGHGVFVFQVGDGTVWPEMVGAEKKLMKKSVSGSSVLQWAEESSECGRTSCSSSTRSCGSNATGFSLLLYAWSVN